MGRHPIYLPNISTEIIDGQEYVCSGSFASLICNVAACRLPGDKRKATSIIKDLARPHGRINLKQILRKARTDDEAMFALLRDVKVMIDISVEKACGVEEDG